MKHEFALSIYGLTDLLQAIPPGGQICLQSKDLYHRIARVLRLSLEQPVVLFDQKTHAFGLLKRLNAKGEVDVAITRVEPNQVYSPAIVVGLPLLKKEALEEAIYGLVEVGVSEIQLLNTQKSQQRWQADKDYSRLERVIVAAAEQSKNYAFPDLREPIALTDFIATESTVTGGVTIFFDSKGENLASVVRGLPKKIQQLTLLIGPEADLADDEKKALQEAGITFCLLTPTILRARQAAVLGAGIFRSLL